MDRRAGMGFAALLAAMLQAASSDAAGLSGRPQVVDGDGLTFGATVVRLHGIDAPEFDQRCPSASGVDWDCGRAAQSALTALIDGASVECRAMDHDRYGRVIARCFVAGHDLAGALVEQGLAWAFVRYSDDYIALEAAARATGIGVWQADTQPAWAYRAERWTTSSAAAPAEGCPIKGNINAEGERIYHTPWSPFYARTRIDEAAGERWFCDEAEAQEAGWRPARF